MVDGTGCVRAFADDTGAAVEDIFRSLPGLAHVFEEYAAISGLYDRHPIMEE